MGGGLAEVPAGLFPATLAGLVTPPMFGYDNFVVVGGGLPAGTLDAARSTNVLPLQGTQQLRLDDSPLLTIAQSPVGAGGTAMGSFGGILPMTLTGSPWLLGVHTLTGTGIGVPTLQVLSGFDARTPFGAGVVQFVAPATARIALVPATAPAGSVLTLEYVAAVGEPVVWALLTGALCVVGRLRC